MELEIERFPVRAAGCGGIGFEAGVRGTPEALRVPA